MAHDTLAPWAETVIQSDRLMSADDLAHLPDEGRGYELVEGRLVKMAPTKGRHGDVTADLIAALRVFAKARHLGRVLASETGFLLSRPGQPDTVLAPDVSFVRTEHVPNLNSPESDTFWPLAPDLVAEVVSTSQGKPEMAEKMRLWLSFGVRLGWVVWPKTKKVDLWLPGHDQPVKTLGVNDALDGLDVVPGFTYAVADLFA